MDKTPNDINFNNPFIKGTALYQTVNPLSQGKIKKFIQSTGLPMLFFLQYAPNGQLSLK